MVVHLVALVCSCVAGWRNVNSNAHEGTTMPEQPTPPNKPADPGKPEHAPGKPADPGKPDETPGRGPERPTQLPSDDSDDSDDDTTAGV